MTIVRELVTQLRYEIDDSNLRKYQNVKPPGSGADWQQAPRNIDGVTNAFKRLKGMLAGIVAGYGIAKLVGISDEWSSIKSRVGLVTDGIGEQQQALDGIFTLAQKTGQSYGAAAGVFQSVQRNAKELGLTLGDNLELTEAISTAMTIGGGSAQAQEAALVQLGQALGSGVLRGDELNSILEQAPRLAQSIAESFGVSVGKLRDLGKEGKLSSKELAQGLIKQLPKLRKELGRVTPTFAISLQRLQNSLGQMIDKWQTTLGLAEKFAKLTNWILANLKQIVGVVAAVAGAWGFGRIVAALQKAVAASGILTSRIAQLAAARALGFFIGSLLRIAAVATAIYYVFDDIMTWFQGGDSLLGRIIGPMTDWAWLVTAISDGFKYISTLLGGFDISPAVASFAVIATVIAGIVLAIGAIPALILVIVLAWASVFNFVHKNWDEIVAGFKSTIADITGWFTGMWDAVLAKASEVWGKIKAIASDAVPDWVKTGASWIGNTVGSAFGGGAPTVPLRAGAVAAGGSTITQAPQITINAPNSNPATIAAAASSGVREGLGASAMVPPVEVPR